LEIPDIERFKNMTIDEMGRIGAEQCINELIEYIEQLEKREKALKRLLSI
jgi:hypothetical protein